jgi:hypothetical protein
MPRPDNQRDTDFVALVADAWREAFEMDVTPDDDFFALGGNSLSALLVLSRLSETLEIPEEHASLVLAGVFDHATLQDFAAFLGSLPLEAC